MLFGHSWGAYAVGSVLNIHKEIEAAVMVAGFDKSTELFKKEGEAIAGGAINLFMPYVSLYERIKFGHYATDSALWGFKNSDANILIIQSENDSMVPPELGYDKFYAAYSNSPRFQFIYFEDLREHDDVYCSDSAREYLDELNANYASHVEKNGGEYNAEIKAEFMSQYLDKAQAFELDIDLMHEILVFFDVSRMT